MGSSASETRVLPARDRRQLFFTSPTNMPSQLTRAKKRLTSSTTRDYSGISRCKGPKVFEVVGNAGAKKAENSKFFITFCERTCINFIPTGLTALLRQKIAESGMIANKSPVTKCD